MLWLCFILGELGFVEMQKTMLLHILTESHEQKLHHLFILAAENFATLEHVHKPTQSSDALPAKFSGRLGMAEYGVPLWEHVLDMASQKASAIKLDASYETGLAVSHTRALSTLIRAFNSSIHGVDCQFSSAARIVYALYKPELDNAAVHNYFLLSAVKQSGQGVRLALENLSLILRLTPGDVIQTRNDNWFAVLLTIHQSALNRNQLSRCKLIEGFMFDFALHYRKASHLCQAWERRNERLRRQGEARAALVSVNRLTRFSEKHGLVYRTMRDHLDLVQLYIVSYRMCQTWDRTCMSTSRRCSWR